MASSKAMQLSSSTPNTDMLAANHQQQQQSLSPSLSTILTDIQTHNTTTTTTQFSIDDDDDNLSSFEGGSMSQEAAMTLEDFLTKAGAVREEDVVMIYGGRSSSIGRAGGKRRVVEEVPMDMATQQKHRRMIKNRESAALSRERKQAYTVELEALVMQLKEEKARLLREEAEKNRERFKQLMENLIPVADKQRPPRILRRVHSVQW